MYFVGGNKLVLTDANMEQSDLFPLDTVQNMPCGTACSKIYSLKPICSTKACITETVEFINNT